MRSLADNYRETHSSNHETIADLVFCALVVLILFILALSVEVSQRIRSETVTPELTIVEDVSALSAEEIEELSAKLQKQRAEIENLKSQLASQKDKVAEQVSALNGEQRFTGAREPAAFTMTFDYRNELYYFAPSKDVDHADRRMSGESVIEHTTRKIRELVEIALKLRETRGFTEREARAIYSALTTYQEVVHLGGRYQLKETEMELYYHTLLSEYVAGDSESSVDHETEITLAIYKMGQTTGKNGNKIYPSCICTVDTLDNKIELNGVRLSPDDLRNILLSVSGRGIILDFKGYVGDPPQWLIDEVLMPAGYVSKTPKLPELN